MSRVLNKALAETETRHGTSFRVVSATACRKYKGAPFLCKLSKQNRYQTFYKDLVQFHSLIIDSTKKTVGHQDKKGKTKES